MSAEFTAAAAKVQDSANAETLKGLSNDKQLEIYSLYKQATAGDCNIAQPGITDQKGRAKWTAWEGRKGMSKEDAEKEYIELIEEILA